MKKILFLATIFTSITTLQAAPSHSKDVVIHGIKSCTPTELHEIIEQTNTEIHNYVSDAKNKLATIPQTDKTKNTISKIDELLNNIDNKISHTVDKHVNIHLKNSK